MDDANINRLRRLTDALDASPSLGEMKDSVSFRGGLCITRIDRATRKRDTLVDDQNLIVTQGRRVFSRLIVGFDGTPLVTKTQQRGIRIVRDTSDSAVDAWVSIVPVSGTNEFTFELWRNDGADVLEFSQQYPSGVLDLNGLVAAVNTVSGWYAETMNGLGGTDAATLLTVYKAPALGDAASYSSGITTIPHTRELTVLKTLATYTTPNEITPFIIGGLRFGTEGHVQATPTTAKDVGAGDEYLSASLRASDYGNATPSEDQLPVSVQYPLPSQVNLVATLAASQGNGLSLSEAGLFTTNGYMIARKNFGRIAKTNLFDLEAVWSLYF